MKRIHHFADLIRLPVGEAGNLVAHLRDIFLKRKNAMGFSEDRLKAGMQIFPVFNTDLGFPVSVNEVIAIGRTGRADQAGGNCQLLERFHPSLFVQSGLRRGFDIKDAPCPPFGNDLDSLGIPVALFQICNIGICYPLFFKLSKRVPEHGKRPVSKDVEFNQTKLINARMHINLCYGPVFLPPGPFEPHMPADGVIGNQETSRMLSQKVRFAHNCFRQCLDFAHFCVQKGRMPI